MNGIRFEKKREMQINKTPMNKQINKRSSEKMLTKMSCSKERNKIQYSPMIELQ